MDATADKDNPSASSLQPSARTEASVAEYLFYHSDHLGTVRLITDNSGAVVSRHDYEPFGVEIAPIVETAGNTHQFTGHERDKATGYDYMHYRSYGSNLGRFMKPDDNSAQTAYDPQSWNLYSYVRGNPVNRNDPSGHTDDQTLALKTPSPDVNVQNTTDQEKPETSPSVEIAKETVSETVKDVGQAVKDTVVGTAKVGYNLVADTVNTLNNATNVILSPITNFQFPTLKNAEASTPGEKTAMTGIFIASLFVGLGEEKAAVNAITKGNPFKGKTAEQISEAFIGKGFEPKGPNPISGKGGYVNPKTGRSFHIDPGSKVEAPHVDVNRLRNYKGPLEKKKYPL